MALLKENTYIYIIFEDKNNNKHGRDNYLPEASPPESAYIDKCNQQEGIYTPVILIGPFMTKQIIKLQNIRLSIPSPQTPIQCSQ